MSVMNKNEVSPFTRSEINRNQSNDQSQNNKNYLRATYQQKTNTSTYFNTGTNNRSQKTLHSYTNGQYQLLKKQNENLKNQIIYFQNIFSKQKGQNNLEHQLFEKINKLELQKNNLKRIIQKSYYSIKQMQKDNDRLLAELNQTKQSYKQIVDKINILERQKQHFKIKIHQIVMIHKDQLAILNNRILSMEEQMNDMISIINHQNNEWQKQKNQLFQIKKHYYNHNL